MNKKHIIILISLFSFLTLQAQTMRDVFKAMPDSVLPTLTTNNRLDMIDFMEAKMKAEVTNLLDGKSEMLALTGDSLCIRMSDALTVEMKTVLAADTICAVRLKSVCQTANRQARHVVENVYSLPGWTLSSSQVLESTLLSRDDKMLQGVAR
ncbi:MAG: DUF3256 family protein [Prevotella sp.]|nr:DUF3256 family protein [Prevotella sp.]